MALTTTTFVTQVPAPINNVLMRGLLLTANKVCPYFNGTKAGTLEKMQGAATVKWRKIENLDPVTAALTEETGTHSYGVGRTAVNPTVSDITVTVTKHGNAIILNEEVDLFNVNSKTVDFINTLGINAGESLNLLMRNVFNAGTTLRVAGNAASATVCTLAISLNDIKYTVNQLNNNSALKFVAQADGSLKIGTVPVRQSYYGIAHVDVEEDIRGLTGFIPVEQYGAYTATEVGEFGAVAGVRWSYTETAPIATAQGTTTADGMRGASEILNNVYSTFIYGREAVGSISLGANHIDEIYMAHTRLPTVEIIQKAVGSSGVGDMFNEKGSIAWKAWFAGKILEQPWLGKLVTLASDLA